MSTFFKNTMTGLLQAIGIDKGSILVKKVTNMPAETYRVVHVTKEDMEQTMECKRISK